MQYFNPNILLIFLSKSSSIFLPKFKIWFSKFVPILSFIKSGIVLAYLSNRDIFESNPFRIFITLTLLELSCNLFSSSFSLVIESKLSSLFKLMIFALFFLVNFLFDKFFFIKFFFNFSLKWINGSELSCWIFTIFFGDSNTLSSDALNEKSIILFFNSL